MPEQTFKPAEAAAIDTFISEANPAVNYGGNGQLQITWDAAGNNNDILMQWDLSSIPVGSTIEAATLSLWLESEVGGIGGMTSYKISRLLAGNSTWTEAGCTWNLLDGANAWAGAAGCETAGTDYALTDLWAGDPWQGAPPMWWVFPLAASEFEYLVNSANYGFKIFSTQRAPGAVRNHIYTSAAGLAANRPELYVRWIEPSGRLVEYTFNVWDPKQRILARDGHEVMPNEVRADKWGKLLGFRSPSSKTYATLADGPDHWYISGVTSDGETVRITPDEKLFADMILKRITR